jgi:hypothetical protein
MNSIFAFISDLKEDFVFRDGISCIAFFAVSFKFEIDENEFTLVHEGEIGIYSFCFFPTEYWLWFLDLGLSFFSGFLFFSSCFGR